MRIEVFAAAGSVARQASELIAAEARAPVAVRDRFVMAVSGLEHAALTPGQIYAMPVESPNLEAAARQYALNKTGRNGDGLVDLSFHNRGAWRPVESPGKRRRWRHIPVCFASFS
jgi:hypothetical protein